MTVSSTTTKNSYSGDGSTTVFAYSFKIFAQSDVIVILRTDSDGTEVVQTISTDYTVSNVGNVNGGNITFTTAPATGKTVVLLRSTSQTQNTDYTPNDPFPAETHEEALDKLTFITQELEEELGRAIKLSRTNTMTSTEFDVGSTDRANKIFAFDSSGELAITQEIGTFRGDWAASTAYNERDIVKDDSNDNIFIVNTSHTSSGTTPLSSNANSSFYDLIVDAEAAATSASNAATSATAAATSATAASTSATAAATSATSAASSATNAGTSETNAENAKTDAVAAKDAALNAQSAAETAKTAAETAKTGAETAKTGAETAKAAAETAQTAAETAESNAATSETNASTSATTATTKASEAATSATNAATSATSASTAQTAAETAQTAAETAQTAAETAKTAAETAETNAETAETNASTSATSASSSATAAAASATTASTKATEASTSATTATTKASEAATSATNAATSETNAATSATSASTAQTAAETAQTAAETAQTAAETAQAAAELAADNFDDTYLGSKTSDPTVDNDGDALTAGDLYFNSTSDQLKYYTGSTWVAIAPGIANVSEDTTPQLGGNLDLNNFNITGTGNIPSANLTGALPAIDGSALTGIATDLVDDTTPQLGGNLDTNGNNINFGDNDKARFGTSQDFQVYFDGTATRMYTPSANTIIRTAKLDVQNGDGSELMAVFNDDSAVSLYYDNAKKFETKSDGVDITGELQADSLDIDGAGNISGTLTMGGNIDLQDNDKILLGTSDDLQIYHDGTHSYIYENGTGSLRVRATEFDVQQVSNGNSIFRSDGSSAQLLENGTVRLETTSTGIDVTGSIIFDGGTTSADINFGDNDRAKFGAGNDLQIWHSGASSNIQDSGTGNLNISADQLVVYNAGASEKKAEFTSNGAVDLYYDNSKKFETTTYGIHVDGTGAAAVPSGTTAQRPTGVQGQIRYNTTDSSFEGYDGSAWGELGGGGGGLFKGENGEVGSSAGDIFRVHEQTLNTNVTIDSDENGLCAGPLTIASGVTLTVNGNLSIV